MKAAILRYQQQQWEKHPISHAFPEAESQLVLCFGSKSRLENSNNIKNIKAHFPKAHIAFCSTAGEIFHDAVVDDSITVSALQFDDTLLHTAHVSIVEFANSYDAAQALLQQLPPAGLNYVLVLSDGSLVNGSELVKGLNDFAPAHVLITGGLAGDGAAFQSTVVGVNNIPTSGTIAAIGFYGTRFHATHGTQGGWEMFGLERTVTRSEGNKLFEMDGKLALDMYKKYLGPDAEQLPGSALLFPLSVVIPGATEPVVRTILSIDEDTNSMTFAGDIPEGSQVRFMKANFDKITAAAASAASSSLPTLEQKPAFSLLVSCVGRKLILGPRTEEEVQAVIEALGDDTPVAGFYSYGEISPFNKGVTCQLHNQTMTITSFYEFS